MFMRFVWKDQYDLKKVLAWIVRQLSCLKTFATNKVSIIHDNSNSNKRMLVKSEENLGDILFRRTNIFNSKNFDLWWYVLETLIQSILTKQLIDSDLKCNEVQIIQSEQKFLIHSVTIKQTFFKNLLEKFETHSYVIKVLAHVNEFINNLKLIPKTVGRLTFTELLRARFHLFGDCKNRHNVKSKSTMKSHELPSNHKLSSLSPFVDKETNLIMVGGRLRHVGISEARKHSFILPYKDVVARKSFIVHHEILVHCGPTLLLPQPKLQGQILSKSVMNCSVDFVEPIKTKLHEAVHIEAVPSFKSEGFIAALRQFVARRVQHMLQYFWKLWLSDYCSDLQKRYKWRKEYENSKVNNLVIKDDNLNPTKWKARRVSELSPDGSRIVIVKLLVNEETRKLHLLKCMQWWLVMFIEKCVERRRENYHSTPDMAMTHLFKISG
uniref:CSON013233 protein n=1 Tax=Culicoides sonorensis TaxID=179676 RepID=A0A336LMZ2_CULSO